MFDPDRGYPAVVPYVRYVDPRAALAWLEAVLAARPAMQLTLPDGRIGHAELRLGNAAALAIGLTEQARPPHAPAERSEVTAMTLVFVDDVDQALRRAVEMGGAVVDGSTDQPWGLRQAIVADPEGHLWELSAAIDEVSAADWGAQLTGPWFY